MKLGLLRPPHYASPPLTPTPASTPTHRCGTCPPSPTQSQALTSTATHSLPLSRTATHYPYHSPGSPAYAIEATLLAIFLGDMVSSFFVARYDKGVLIGDRRTLIKIYLKFRCVLGWGERYRE